MISLTRMIHDIFFTYGDIQLQSMRISYLNYLVDLFTFIDFFPKIKVYALICSQD